MSEEAVASSARPSPWVEMRIALSLQRTLGFLLLPFLYPATVLWMRWVRRYHIHNLDCVREKCKKLLGRSAGPLIVCPNHLTMIDSFFVMWGLSSLGGYLFDFRRFPWNFPERRNFYNRLSWRLLCYFGQCIGVLREGPRDATRILLAKMKHLLANGHALLIFPEGTRSRSGRVDTQSCTYGVGQLLVECPDARVLCVYLRGEAQASFSRFPVKGERFFLDVALIEPRSAYQGLRAARDMSQQVVNKLVELENDYFDGHAQSNRQ